MRLDLITADVARIQPFLETVFQDGGKKLYSIEGEIKTISNINGYSGYSYKIDGAEASLTLGMILGGTGYALKRTLKSATEEFVRFDYFNVEGDLTFTADSESLTVVFVDNIAMDPTCPILNHLYNFLSLEYRKAEEAESSTEAVFSVEKWLRTLYRSKTVSLSIKRGAEDIAFTTIFNKILKAELDPVLNWEERQLVFRKYRQTMKKIMATKVRAHRLNKTKMKVALFKKNCGNLLARILARPANNFGGILHRYTIGKILWFFKTVSDNLGYSIALAVYGPFTYYFITMPMNPHAMQAVGKVRAAYLDAKYEISRLIDTKGESLIHKMDVGGSETAQAAAKTTPVQTQSDNVSTKDAAPLKVSEQDVINANILYQSEVTSGASTPNLVMLGDGKKTKARPSIMNMLVSSDVAEVNNQNWLERMSHFKQMQIAYEESIEYASRLGRLEQLETQYNFPMQVESTWEELERYNQYIFKIRTETPNLSAKMKQYLFNEVNRTQQLQVYLWDRLVRFILDQKYVMLDEDKEQKRNDYYVGRSFVFMQEMTQVLSWRYKELKKPEGFDKIEKLADFYSRNRKEFGTVLKNLQANSDLFKQKDVYDTKEFRSYMKRQWEILYLQNAKAEEASNMGLNMYIWSVRNAVWILQSIYSTKREELAMLLKRDISGQMFSPAEATARSKMSMMYETLFHNLTLEYVGIREEIMNRLGKDIESNQRMVVINNLKEFLTDRDKLDGINVASSTKTAGSEL